MDFLKADSLPWLASAQARIRVRAAGRLPHSLLLLSAPGLGVESLAHWTTAFALCERQRGARAACPSCLLLRRQSPGCAHRALEEDAQQIKVDQVRELIEALALTSYRGGYKVGHDRRAELLNANGANAFLKTLEEPTQNTLLILIAKPSHRLPATIASRCLRLTCVRRAPRGARWLARRRHSPAGLGCRAGAGRRRAAAGLEIRRGDSRRSTRDARGPAGLAAGSVDVTLLAEPGSNRPGAAAGCGLRTGSHAVRLELGGGPNSLQSAEPVRLPAALLKPKIKTYSSCWMRPRVAAPCLDGHESTTGAGGPAARRSGARGIMRLFLRLKNCEVQVTNRVC
jgi:hypothetical protein